MLLSPGSADGALEIAHLDPVKRCLLRTEKLQHSVRPKDRTRRDGAVLPALRAIRDNHELVPLYELAIWARFVFHGARFEKIAMSMARDERGWGSIFMGEADAETEGEPLLLPPEVAAWWKPERGVWAGVVEGRGERVSELRLVRDRW